MPEKHPANLVWSLIVICMLVKVRPLINRFTNFHEICAVFWQSGPSLNMTVVTRH